MASDNITHLEIAADKVRELHRKIPGLIGDVTANGAMSSSVTETIKYKLEEILKEILSHAMARK